MIRRKISSGLLRASKSSSSLRATALQQASPVTPIHIQQTAGLASTSLGAQRNWGKETVVTLKQELKNRGLSQTGNKSLLVDRLKSSEATAFLPPMPVTPSHQISTANFARHISTSATVSAPKKGKSKSDAPITEVEAPISTDTVLSTGPEVVSQRTEAPKTEEISPATEAAAPGLPETQVAAEPDKDALGIQLPEITDKVPEVAQSIPLVPDNFEGKPATQEEPETEAHTPKVVTVASASTHIGGGPTHALHEATDPHTLEEDPKEPEIDVEALAASFSSALGAPGRAFTSTGIPKALLPTIGSAKGFVKPEKEYKASDKKLNDEEKRGAWIFGGIVGLGLLLGGGKKKKSSHSDDHDESSKGKGSSGKKGGAQGDAEWNKASGAGIVGHGARKD